PCHNPANLLVAPAASRPATVERAQISSRRLKSSDNSQQSTPPAAHSSAASPSHILLDRLDPNRPARPRHSNPHSACGTALRSLSAVIVWGFFCQEVPRVAN